MSKLKTEELSETLRRFGRNVITDGWCRWGTPREPVSEDEVNELCREHFEKNAIDLNYATPTDAGLREVLEKIFGTGCDCGKQFVGHTRNCHVRIARAALSQGGGE